MKPRQEHILDVATELFHRRGYFQTGIAEINKKAGVSKGVFYHYFPGGKIQLVRSVLQRDYDNSKTMMDKYFLDNDVTSATRLFVENLKEKINTPDYSSIRMSILFSEMMEAKEADSEIIALAKKTFSLIELKIENKLITDGIPDLIARKKAKQVNAMIEGGVTIGIIRKSTEYLEIVSDELDNIFNGSD